MTSNGFFLESELRRLRRLRQLRQRSETTVCRVTGGAFCFLFLPLISSAWQRQRQRRRFKEMTGSCESCAGLDVDAFDLPFDELKVLDPNIEDRRRVAHETGRPLAAPAGCPAHLVSRRPDFLDEGFTSDVCTCFGKCWRIAV